MADQKSLATQIRSVFIYIYVFKRHGLSKSKPFFSTFYLLITHIFNYPKTVLVDLRLIFYIFFFFFYKVSKPKNSFMSNRTECNRTKFLAYN